MRYGWSLSPSTLLELFLLFGVSEPNISLKAFRRGIYKLYTSTLFPDICAYIVCCLCVKLKLLMETYK